VHKSGVQSTLAEKIGRYRKAQQMSLTELARRADVSRSYLYQIESGESSPTLKVLKSLATALGVRVSDLVGEEKRLNIPESLERFAAEYNIEPGDLEMLAQINYRGRRPTTPEEWRVLWRVIKATVGEE
jgi:transcriptional regulator with XRE-family HTH domain